MRIMLAASAIAAAAAPASAFAVDYLSADQAAKLMFPDADAFESRSLTLDAAQMQQLDAQGVHARSANWACGYACTTFTRIRTSTKSSRSWPKGASFPISIYRSSTRARAS